MSNQKITDKYFNKMMASSIISIVVCMMCLASLTWAWFSVDMQSSGNTLASASFQTTVSITPDDPSFVDHYDLMLPANKYNIVVTQIANAKTGYCLVKIDGTSYYAGSFTPKLNADTRKETYSIEFELNITGNAARVSICPVWGIFSGIQDELPNEITGNAAITTESADAEETAEVETSEAETTEAETSEAETTEAETSEVETTEAETTEAETSEVETTEAVTEETVDEITID